MKHIYRLILGVLAVLVMQGCATHANFIKKYDAWVGQDINAFIQRAGYPDSTYTLPNKHTVYVYARSRVYSVPSMPMMGYGYGGYYYNGYGMFTYGNEVVQESCNLYLETDLKGKIVMWGSRGNRCVSE
ncbi:MAG: hypothetical protein B7Y23_05995 [Sulfurovum sp. 16-42-52]|nr:MAG: hypothetical protein B7Y23_05995 [Sulfurovum sp. 16-42-52]OZA44109.1 MAG: hypothetical protein B7X80_08330 [Sulfurovum sp. 17-42-90]